MNDLHKFQLRLADFGVGRHFLAVHFIAKKFNGDGAGALAKNIKERAAYGRGDKRRPVLPGSGLRLWGGTRFKVVFG